MKAAIVLGASGSVGNALTKELIHHGSFGSIATLVRRSQPGHVAMARGASADLREVLVPDMDPAGLQAATTEAVRALEGDVTGFSVLGIGAGTAKLTIDQHRAVDVHLNTAFARGLKASSQHTPWLLEKALPLFSFLTPAKYRSISVEQIARAMIATALNTPAKTEVYHYAEMVVFSRR